MMVRCAGILSLSLEVSKRIGTFIQHICHGHSELFTHRRAAIVPAHEGFTLQKHLLGGRLYLLHFPLGEAASKQTFCTHTSKALRAAELLLYFSSW